MYIYNSNFAVQQGLTQQCKSTIQLKKKKKHTKGWESKWLWTTQQQQRKQDKEVNAFKASVGNAFKL